MTRLESDLGWAAGLVDGEGHICLERKPEFVYGRRSASFSPRVNVYNCNEAIIQRFARIMRCGTIRRNKPTNPAKHKVNFCWRVGGPDAVAVCRLLLPYLTKCDQAALLIEAGPLILAVGRPKGTRNPNVAKLERIHRDLRKLTRRGPQPDLATMDAAEIQWKITAEPIPFLTPQLDLRMS